MRPRLLGARQRCRRARDSGRLRSRRQMMPMMATEDGKWTASADHPRRPTAPAPSLGSRAGRRGFSNICGIELRFPLARSSAPAHRSHRRPPRTISLLFGYFSTAVWRNPMKKQKHASRRPPADAGATQGASNGRPPGRGQLHGRARIQPGRTPIRPVREGRRGRPGRCTQDRCRGARDACRRTGRQASGEEDYPPRPRRPRAAASASRREPAKDAPRKPG